MAAAIDASSIMNAAMKVVFSYAWLQSGQKVVHTTVKLVRAACNRRSRKAVEKQKERENINKNIEENQTKREITNSPLVVLVDGGEKPRAVKHSRQRALVIIAQCLHTV